MTVVEQVFQLFERHDTKMYFGEAVSILEHSLQAAELASRAHAGDALIVAALLHDVGHLLHDLPEDVAALGIDGRHEIVGEQWLRVRFGPEVCEPVRLHVDAKRYLCAVDPEYLTRLSRASRESLRLQGGVFNFEEIASFERNCYFRDALRLRQWDDTAKTLEAQVSPLRTYSPAIARAAGETVAPGG